MQFTVLIEFLIPGVATTILLLNLLLPDKVSIIVPHGHDGDAMALLILLAISYPVGIVVNFAIFILIQDGLLTPTIRRRLLEYYENRGVDLWVVVGSEGSDAGTKRRSAKVRVADLSTLFGVMRAAVFMENIERLNFNHSYHEGLQRLARGIMIPLLLSRAVVRTSESEGWGIALCISFLLVFSFGLLVFSIKREEEQIVRFFLEKNAVRPVLRPIAGQSPEQESEHLPTTVTPKG